MFGTLNINLLLKPGKLKQLTKALDELKLQIVALQEPRFTDENIMDNNGYRIFKGKKGLNPADRGKGIPHLGMGFIVKSNIIDSITDFYSPNKKLSILTFHSAN